MESLSFDVLFASAGIFGVELSSTALANVGRRIAVRGHLTGPLMSDASSYVLTRSSLPHCPFCSNHNHWPDDAVVVTFAGGEPATVDDERAIDVVGMLEAGDHYHESGLTSALRLIGATVAVP